MNPTADNLYRAFVRFFVRYHYKDPQGFESSFDLFIDDFFFIDNHAVRWFRDTFDCWHCSESAYTPDDLSFPMWCKVGGTHAWRVSPDDPDALEIIERDGGLLVVSKSLLDDGVFSPVDPDELLRLALLCQSDYISLV